MGADASDPLSQCCCAKAFVIKDHLDDGVPQVQIDDTFYFNEHLIISVQKRVRGFLARARCDKMLKEKRLLNSYFTLSDQ